MKIMCVLCYRRKIQIPETAHYFGALKNISALNLGP